jgi:predicted lipoprotein with Yx(FWY)xxD motif
MRSGGPARHSRLAGKEPQPPGVLEVDHKRRSLENKMKTRRLLLVSIVAGTLGLTGSAFGQSAHASAATVVTAKQTSLGLILVTSSGQTLYLDAADKPGHPACTGGCLSIWPPLKATGALKAAGKAKGSMLGTTKIAGGIKQVTYNGHPLYTFTSDSKSNPTSGEGQNGFYVVSPSGAKITKSTKTTTTTTSSSSGGYHY